jgi:8-amino-3,8-dideoxy-alpha-D-manno-octulosonate transaminase
MENHPVLGFNYRISELHAAVGLAQTRKVPFIREKNLHNKSFLQTKLRANKAISFATLGDDSGDSATFLNIFLPDTETAKRVVAEMNAAGVGGFNYWYTNMYHFINQWDHLKNLQTVSKLPVQLLGSSQDYTKMDLPKSQEVVGRLISFGVRCTWTEEEMSKLADAILNCVEKAMAPVHA